jgi:hypothetical protein
MEDLLFEVTNYIFIFFMWIFISEKRAKIFFITFLIICLLLAFLNEKFNNK